MANLIEIVIKASGGSAAAGEMQKASGGLTGLNSGVNSFLGGMRNLDSTMAGLGVGLGLMSLVKSTEQWVSDAVTGAAAEERLSRTFTNVAGGAANAAAYLEAMTVATKRQVDDGQLMATGLDVINLKLVQTPAQMEQYIAVSKRLGSEFGNMGFDEAVSGFNRMMEAGSVSARFLLNYGISADNVKARIVELQAANSSLSDSDAARQAVMAEALATYQKLGPVQRDMLSAQKEMAAAQAGFQDAFGALVLTMGNSTGVFDAVTNAMRNLQGGAEAWTAYNQQTQAGGDALRATQQNLINSTTSLDEYNAAVTRAIQGAGPLAQIFGIGRNLYLTTQQYQAMKAGLDEAGNAAKNTSSDVGRYNAALSASSSATATAKTAASGYSAALRTVAMTQEDVNKKLDEYRSKMAFAGSPYSAEIARANQLDNAWGVILAKSAEYRNELMANSFATSPYAGGVSTANTQAQIDQQKEYQKRSEDAYKEQQDSIKQAADALRSTIESVMQPTLDEVWKPPEGSIARIDENARRLATVSTQGFKSEWLNQLNTQFAGMSFWQPIADAMASGNEGVLKTAATNLLSGPGVMQLWDVPTIVTKVKEQLAAQDARTQIMNAVMAQLSGEGVQVNAGEVSAAMGGGGIAGTLAGNLASDMQGAITQSGAGSALVSSLKDGVVRADKESAALASAIANGLTKAWTGVTKESAASLIQELVKEVRNQLGANKAAATAGTEARP